MFEPNLSKVVSKFEIKLERFVFLELNRFSNSKFLSLMKLQFDEMRALLSTAWNDIKYKLEFSLLSGRDICMFNLKTFKLP